MNTVLITGCSSGFGLDTASYFLDRGWTVIATMRTPREICCRPRTTCESCRSTSPTQAASRGRSTAAGPIDVLVNNAGVGMVSPLEGVSMDKIRELVETNTLGTIAMTQAVLPQMREQGSGVIVNVTSGVTFQPLPLMSIYTASKAAVNAFTELVALELEPLGVRVRIVIPGRAPETPFGDNARGRMGLNIPDPYQALAAQMFGRFGAGGDVSYSRDVSEAVWRAATDPTCPCACQPARTPSPALGPRRGSIPPPALSEMSAVVRLTIRSRPSVSTAIWRLRPTIFLPAS